MRAQRGIALPTVIIILLLTASAAGWILYFKNQKTLAEIEAAEKKLADQTALTKKAEGRADGLQAELDTAKAENRNLAKQIDELSEQASKLKEENTVIATLQTTVSENESQIATLQSTLGDKEARITTLQNTTSGLQDQIASLTSEKAVATEQIAALTKSRDEAIESDQRGRTQLAELLAHVESGQQNSAEYLAQLESARSELATTSEQAELLQQRLQALEAEREREREEFRALQEKLNAELGKNSVNIDQSATQLTIIRLQDDVLFNSGSARLLQAARSVLKSISDVLQKYPGRLIQVEGHTDNVPVSKNSRYPTNWELSAARASSAVRYLINNTDIDPQRLRVAGLGEYNPIAENNTAEGQARNRRIEITLLPANGLREEAIEAN